MQIKKISTVIIVVILVVFLALIRTFEKELFYDPFLNYFKQDFNNNLFPALDGIRLGTHILFRYFLNTVISLGIIYAIFRDTSLLKFSAFLYILFFLILIGLFYWVLYYKGSESAWLLFYVRRFLIQPVFILLFIPAFYYQLQSEKK